MWGAENDTGSQAPGSDSSGQMLAPLSFPVGPGTRYFICSSPAPIFLPSLQNEDAPLQKQLQLLKETR